MPAVRWSVRRLDVLLELLERRDLSPAELRILLAVGHGQAELEALSNHLGRPKPTVRRSAWRLYVQGMLRQENDGASNEPTFAITTRGLAALKPLITASNVRLERR